MQFKSWGRKASIWVILATGLVALMGCQPTAGRPAGGADTTSRPPSVAAVAPISGVPAVPMMQPASAAPGAIVVHGHWSFDVVEPDGRLVRHTEVENALTSEGATLLAGILSGDLTRGPGPWQVPLALTGTAGGGISTSLAQVGLGPADRLLTVDVPTSGPDLNKLVLTGNLTNTNFDAHVTSFGTSFNACNGPTCGLRSFTSHTVPAPPDASAIVVAVHQILQVKVVISFAPAT